MDESKLNVRIEFRLKDGSYSIWEGESLGWKVTQCQPGGEMLWKPEMTLRNAKQFYETVSRQFVCGDVALDSNGVCPRCGDRWAPNDRLPDLRHFTHESHGFCPKCACK